jgi:hypothetical protein
MPRRRRGLAAAAATAGTLLLAGNAGGAAAVHKAKLGSTTGTPSANICVSGFRCTYLPRGRTALRVPFKGTVTSFRVNAGSATGKVWLRVLRPAGGGKFTGIATSAPKTLALGVNSFSVSLRVKKGDLIGLDNSSSALMFDTSSATARTDYYELPPLRNHRTAAPNRTQSGYRLLLSATVHRRP